MGNNTETADNREDCILCPYCKTRNIIINQHCINCRRRLKKRNILPLLLVLILVYGLFYFVISNVGIYTPQERIEYVDMPYVMIKEVNTSIPFQTTECNNRSFRYSTQGGNVNSIKGYVVPNLVINNLEEIWGSFKVNFSYIPENKFPYNIFGAENLKESLLSGKIGYDDADFYSENYEFYIGPGESIIINNRTIKKDKKMQYWAIANIIEPKIQECSKKMTYSQITQNKTFTEFRKTERKVTIKEYKKLKEVIGIKTFLEGFAILLLLMLILLLLFRIGERYNLLERYKKYIKDAQIKGKRK